jgi:hypothetical protein
MQALEEATQYMAVPDWLLHLAAFPACPSNGVGLPPHRSDVDPQRGWYALHHNIGEFPQAVPAAQQLRVRGEDVLTDPDRELAAIAGWLGLQADAEALEAMKHPERSPYACFGPPGAPFGNDFFFFRILCFVRRAPSRRPWMDHSVGGKMDKDFCLRLKISHNNLVIRILCSIVPFALKIS